MTNECLKASTIKVGTNIRILHTREEGSEVLLGAASRAHEEKNRNPTQSILLESVLFFGFIYLYSCGVHY